MRQVGRLLCAGLLCAIALSSASLVRAQAPAAGAGDTADVLKALDQVIEQNRKLEQQNRELMDQVNLLRQRLAAGSTAAEESAKAAATPSAQGGAQDDQNQSAQRQPYVAPPNTFEPDKKEATLIRTNPFAAESNGTPAMFGEFNPGQGFTVAKGEVGRLNLSGILVARYLNQYPADQTATDHLGRPITVTPRQDFQFHRVMLFASGWLFNPKFNYQSFVWTVQDTNQSAIGGALWYVFNNHLTLGGGWQALPGTQSLQGSHPYWTSYDRVMADEFFRPYFTQGVFGVGRLFPKLEYRWTVGNNLSNLDVPATKLDRGLAVGGALTWLPTTGEFGPRGAFGDYEMHEHLATRFNFAYTRSVEDRYTDVNTTTSNTTIRLADSLNVFDFNAFGPGITGRRISASTCRLRT